MADFSCEIKYFTITGTEITGRYLSVGLTTVKAIFTQLSGTPVLGENGCIIRLDVVDSLNQASIIEIEQSLITESIDGNDVIFETIIDGSTLSQLPKISTRIYPSEEPFVPRAYSSAYSNAYG